VSKPHRRCEKASTAGGGGEVELDLTPRFLKLTPTEIFCIIIYLTVGRYCEYIPVYNYTDPNEKAMLFPQGKKVFFKKLRILYLKNSGIQGDYDVLSGYDRKTEPVLGGQGLPYCSGI